MRISKVGSFDKTSVTVPRKWEGAPETKRPRPGFHVTTRMVVLIVIVILAALVYWWWTAHWIVTTGELSYERWELSPQFAGRIAEVPVREGERVKAGQALFRLATGQLDAELRSARAQFDAAGEHLRALQQQGLDPAVLLREQSARGEFEMAKAAQQRASAGVEEVRTVAKRAQSQAQRAERTFLLKAITRDEYERALTDSQRAQQQLAMAAADLEKARAAVVSAERVLSQATGEVNYQKQKLAEQIALARHELARTQGGVEALQARLQESTLYAPHDGIIGWVNHHVGENVDQNNIVVMLYDPSQVWVEAYVEGDDFGYLRDGRQARITFNSTRGRFPGKVQLYHPVERPGDGALPIARAQVRAASNIKSVLHPVKITFDKEVPDLPPKAVANVRIARR